MRMPGQPGLLYAVQNIAAKLKYMTCSGYLYFTHWSIHGIIHLLSGMFCCVEVPPFCDGCPLPLILSRKIHDDPDPAEKIILAVTFLSSRACRAHVAGTAAGPPLLYWAGRWHFGSLNLVQQVFHILQVCPTWLPADATVWQPQSCSAGLPYTASLPHWAACR